MNYLKVEHAILEQGVLNQVLLGLIPTGDIALKCNMREMQYARSEMSLNKTNVG